MVQLVNERRNERARALHVGTDCCPLGCDLKVEHTGNGRFEPAVRARGDVGGDGRAEYAPGAGHHAQVLVPVGDAKRTLAVADEVGRAGHDNEAVLALRELLDQLRLLPRAQGAAAIDAALLDDLGRAVDGGDRLDLRLIAFDDVDVAAR